MPDAFPDAAVPSALPRLLDHLVLAVHDLQAGIDEFEGLSGVRPQFGGAHPGRTPHPATSSPPGCTLVGLRLEDAEPDELRRIFDRLGISAAVARGARSIMRLRLACPTGRVEIPVHRE